MKFLLQRLAASIVVALGCVAIAMAQGTTAVILGTVRDTTGAVLPGVSIQVKNQDTGIVRNVTTGSGGRYRAPALEIGTYEVQASLTGFSKMVKSGIALTVGSEVTVDLTMALGEVSQIVTVTGEVPLVETTNAQVSGLVGDKEIRDLPLNGRSYEQLTFLQPGVVRFTAFNSGTTSTRVFNGAGAKMSVGGTPMDFTSFLLDGTDLHDNSNFTPGSVTGNNLGVDSIQEFRVLTQNYGAEYGRTGGGVVYAATRAGANSFHGGAFEFLRNNVLDARQFFDRGGAKPFRRNQFGAFAGGRIIRDHTFFFGNYEGLRERLSLTNISTVPDADAHQGILPSPTGPLNVGVAPSIRPYLDAMQLPNGRNFGDGTAQFVWAFSQPSREDFGTLRIDHQISDRNSFFGRFTLDDAQMIVPRFFPQFVESGQSRNTFVTLEQKTIISGQSLNVIRFAFNRTNAADDGGISTLPNYAALAFIPGRRWSAQFTSTIGAGSGALTEFGSTASQPVRYPQNIFQITDDVYLTRGRHALKMGVNLERLQNNDYENTQDGTYSFSDLTQFLRGSPNRFTAQLLGSANGFGYRQWLAGLYVQDDLRVRDTLTLNLGLRYEFVTVPTEVHGWLSSIRNIRTDTGPTIGQPPYNNPSLLNFEPRFGFAWTPWGKKGTVLRGGFGFYQNQWMGKVAGTPPQSAFKKQVIISNPPFPNPGPQFYNASSGTISYLTVDPNIKTPTVNQFNFTLERQLFSDFVFSVGYAGHHGFHFLRAIEGNTNVPSYLPNGTPFYTGGPRVNPNFASAERILTDSVSNYHSLQLRVTKAFSHSFQFQANYTFSKGINDGSQWRSAQTLNTATASLIPHDRSADRGISPYNQGKAFGANVTYRLPGESLSGWKAAVARGWEMNGIISASSGLPFSVAIPFNQSQNGDSQVPDRPNLVPGRSNNPIIGTVNKWYDPTAFSLPARGFYGNLGRDTLQGPGIAAFDFSLVKNFDVGESNRLIFRAELFNLFNHPNFGLPNRNAFTSTGVIAGNAGVITSLTTPSRQIQFGLRYTF